MKQKLRQLIESVPELMETAQVCRELGLPNFYIAGGAITQLIWNIARCQSGTWLWIMNRIPVNRHVDRGGCRKVFNELEQHPLRFEIIGALGKFRKRRINTFEANWPAD
ncbi:hypothetical protein [Photobacterium sp. TY1-4]|uniref:hypothetical protein n=1 Tax=Photobacterium sp. TY1-4 TaxID=2899122 RepID=UPI0021BFAC25|nr:hypothetical protein [Photobacterium sp. TY1-4]UXI04656.1 hypothetical protein NH461_25050 [Photobacterium sp. TY1-4]